MEKFIGREKELATLNGLYNSDKFEFAVIYGRRRVGKTALISHFIQDKKAIYFIGRFWKKPVIISLRLLRKPENLNCFAAAHLTAESMAAR